MNRFVTTLLALLIAPAFVLAGVIYGVIVGLALVICLALEVYDDLQAADALAKQQERAS